MYEYEKNISFFKFVAAPTFEKKIPSLQQEDKKNYLNYRKSKKQVIVLFHVYVYVKILYVILLS